MKKNLLFALSVFLITIVGLLVFSEASDKPKEDTSSEQVKEQQLQESQIASIK